MQHRYHAIYGVSTVLCGSAVSCGEFQFALFNLYYVTLQCNTDDLQLAPFKLCYLVFQKNHRRFAICTVQVTLYGIAVWNW